MSSSSPIHQNFDYRKSCKGSVTVNVNESANLSGAGSLNPSAPAFLPGARVSGRGFEVPPPGADRSHDARNPVPKQGKERGRRKPEGGIAKALQKDGQPNKAVESSPLGQYKSPSTREGEVTADSSILGRSPQQRYTPANHLMNFQPRYAQTKGARPEGQTGRNRGGPRRQQPRPLPYDSKKFLQANFRFLAGDAGNLHQCEKDPDLALDWEDVVEVEMMVQSPLRCPISLDSPPLCPQITPCGHVFAFPSIMTYLMNYGGDNLRRASPCPLCYTPIAARELRLLRAVHVTPPKVGDTTSFVLLKRHRSSVVPTLAKPEVGSPSEGPDGSKKTTSGPRKSGSSPAAAAEECGWQRYNPYAAFTCIDVEEARKLWHAAAEVLADYAVQVTSEGGMEAAMEAPYVYAALDALAARAASWAERRQRHLVDASSPSLAATLQDPHEAGAAMAAAVKKVSSAAVTAAVQNREAAVKEARRAEEYPALPSAPPPAPGRPSRAPATSQAGTHLLDAFSEDEDEVSPGNVSEDAPDDSPGVIELRQSPRDASMPAFGVSPGDMASCETEDTFYVYQAQDGQWVFLTPFNMRALLAHYGSYANLPARMAGRLLELEELVQSPALRRRYKFLSHLPLTGSLKLAEIELAELLPAESLAPFVEETKSRAQRRQRRAAADARKEAALEAATAAALAASAPPSLQQLQVCFYPSYWIPLRSILIWVNY
eukprot:jgi/Botrbrau1/9642/Bobra.0131s0019.2